MIKNFIKSKINIIIKNLHIQNSIFFKSKYAYKLYKNMNKYYIINEKPIIKEEEYTCPIVEDKYKNFYIFVNNFINIMESNLSKDNKYIMYHNLKTFTFSNYDEANILTKLLTHLGICGNYNYRKNNIFVNDNNISVEKYSLIIYHELLHMSSYCKSNNNTYVGFRNNFIGNAINEGYTQLLTERYFNNGNRYLICSYNYYVNIAKIIEDIVGKEMMTDLYFNADLNGLIKELNNYAKKDDIIDFLLNLDTKFRFDFRLSYFLNNNNSFLINNINNFLINTYINKLIINNAQKDIITNSIIELNNKLNLLDQEDIKNISKRNIVKKLIKRKISK